MATSKSVVLQLPLAMSVGGVALAIRMSAKNLWPAASHGLVGSLKSSGLKKPASIQIPSVGSSRNLKNIGYRSNSRPYYHGPSASWKQEIVWTKVKVSDTVRATEELVSLTLDISQVPELQSGFTKPGQFVQVKIGASKPTFLSIASTPKAAEKGAFEFLIKDVPGTTASEICALGVGAEVEVSQVLGGGFPLNKIPSDQFDSVVIFATGSGISPIRSVIEHGFEADKRKDVRLYFGAENLEKMAYKDRFPAWESSGVKVIPVLSDGGDSWDGEKGFVQEAYNRADKVPEPEKAAALLCGQREMLEELKSILTTDGLSSDAILTNF